MEHIESWSTLSDEMNGLIERRYQALDRLDYPEDASFREAEACDDANAASFEKINRLGEENRMLRESLNRIYGSRGWRYLCFCYRLKDRLIPRGSMRYKIARKLFRILRFIKRSVRNLNKDTANKFRNALRWGGLAYAVKKTREYNRRRAAAGSAGDLPGKEERERLQKTIEELRQEAQENTCAARERLIFSYAERPVASIIIPAYNQFAYTYNCLKSILETCKGISYEVIVADDNSSDETRDLAKFSENIRHVRNESNLGFLRNCNNAARLARGKYIVFLNNDTKVLEHWLSSLIETMEKDETVGLAGSKLIYPDGTLQEAGGIVWNDATGANYGRGRDPFHAEYNYVKEVDYVSGASIIIRKTLWDEIGGFDEIYAPAYCEDSDLAFEVRRRGFRVVYNPARSFIHLERVFRRKRQHGLGVNVQKPGLLAEKWA